MRAIEVRTEQRGADCEARGSLWIDGKVGDVEVSDSGTVEARAETYTLALVAGDNCKMVVKTA